MTTAHTTTITKPRLLRTIAADIEQSWDKVNYAAKPYLEAMHELNTLEDRYGWDSAEDIVRRFLINATFWRGPKAREIKAELNTMLNRKRATQ